jgi:hypothetical protein
MRSSMSVTSYLAGNDVQDWITIVGRNQTLGNSVNIQWTKTLV